MPLYAAAILTVKDGNVMLAETLKTLKNQRGWSNQKLADAANLPVDTVNKILSGSTKNPNTDTLRRLADALEVTLDDLYSPSAPAPREDAAAAGGSLAAFYAAALDTQRRVYETAIAEARTDKRRWFVVSIVLIAFVMFLLGWDITHPDMGYIRY